MTDQSLPGRSTWLIPALVLIAVAFALRGWLFGNPVIHVDEQFYLLVGNRMLAGAVPFVDIWDRKPLGLFALYAAFDWLGGVLAYQIAAMLFAAVTAFVIFRIALRIAMPAGALVAGIAYLAFMLIFNGAGGQSPVFYELLVCVGALATMRLVIAPSHRLAIKGAGVMLLLGLAIQVKYTVIFEGVFFGLALMWRALRDGKRPLAVVAMAVLWMAVALVPTSVVLGIYTESGHLDAFVQSNFLSIFGRHQNPWPALMRLVLFSIILTPFWLAILRAPRHLVPARLPEPGTRGFLRGWAVSAVAGYIFFGSYYDHYTIALLPPLAVLASPMLGRRGKGRGYTISLLAVGIVGGLVWTAIRLNAQGNAREIAAMTAAIRPHLAGGGCMHIYEGDSILYRTTGACMTTRFVFPSHLDNAKEADALGVSSIDEMRRVLGKRPAVIVMWSAPRRYLTNFATRAILEEALARDYHRVAELPVGEKTNWVYVRNDAP